MLELAGPAAGGVGVTAGALILSGAAPGGGVDLRSALDRAVARVAAGLGLGRGQAVALGAALAVAAVAAAWFVEASSGVPLLAAGAGAGIPLGARAVAGRSARRRRQRLEDAVLESIRMLRRLLDTGGVGVQQALAAVAVRGPSELRPEFSALVAAAAAGRQEAEWVAARSRVADPAFDLLAAAIAVQRPAGGRLGPLFGDLEEAAAAHHEVVREAEAMQVQARGAATMIMALPVCFLGALALLGSPYLAVYRSSGGQVFLAGAFLVMGLGYAWMLRWLRLPAPPRLGVRGA